MADDMLPAPLSCPDLLSTRTIALFAHTPIASVFGMALSSCASHWRQLFGAALVATFVFGLQLAHLGDGTAAAITLVFSGTATFLACYDFEGARKGVIWSTAILVFGAFLVIGLQDRNWLVATICGLVCVFIVGRLIQRIHHWNRDYRRAHPVIHPDDIVYIEANF